MASKMLPANPFFTVIDIPDEFFCDREKETEAVISLLGNGNNIVLKAQRRIGKSSLIHHIFNQEPVKSGFNTLYVDIFGTKNLDDFHWTFQNKLLNAPFVKGTRLKKDFEMLVKGLNVSLGGYNPMTGSISSPRIGMSPSQMPRIPMEELFDILERTKKPNIVVFDEFQQIQYYPEKMAAILRSFTQKMNNTKFIFSGSSPHMLTIMFQMASQPFYKSAEPFEIKPLPLEIYARFCRDIFSMYGKTVMDDAVKFLYAVFSGETAPMQETMNYVFGLTKEGQTAGTETVKSAISSLLDNRDTSFREIINRIERDKTRDTLFCIAALGIGRNLTSSKIMKDFHLDNASSVQKSILSLMDENSPLIKKIAKGTYVMDDRLFELWIAREGNYLDLKYELAEKRFVEQTELENPTFTPTPPR